MSEALPNRLPDSELRQTRPPSLPAVEPELQTAFPRPAVWVDREGRPLDREILQQLQRWQAVKAWIARVVEIPDREGPDFHIWLGFEWQGQLRQTRLVCGFDLYHWAVGAPDHYRWFNTTIHKGRATTLLLAPDGERQTFYGNTRAYVVIDGARCWAADRDCPPTDPVIEDRELPTV